jgi:hypothetical protein
MKTFSTLIFLAVANTLCSQTPVNWSYTANKIADKTYEVHIKAGVQSPWHIYSQTTPDGGPLPTKFTFSKNPLFVISGQPIELGKLLQKHEEAFGVDVKYFDGDVDFVQLVKLKSNAKTILSGTMEFMACNDEQCLPPTTNKFSITLD